MTQWYTSFTPTIFIAKISFEKDLEKIIINKDLRIVRFYLIKGAIVHGWVGLFLSYLDAHYVRMKYGKLLALQRGLPLEHEARE